MRPTVVARRYARALAEAAAEGVKDQLDAVGEDLAPVAEALGAEPGIMRFFADPSIPELQKFELIDTAAKKVKMNELTRNFLRLLVQKRRMHELPAIRRAYEEIKDEWQGIVAARATTAQPLKADEAKRYQQAVEKMTGSKVRMTFDVDPAVLGGARTKIGSQVYDGTLRRRLDLLRERLVGGK